MSIDAVEPLEAHPSATIRSHQKDSQLVNRLSSEALQALQKIAGKKWPKIVWTGFNVHILSSIN